MKRLFMGHLTYLSSYIFRRTDAGKVCVWELIFQAPFNILAKSPLKSCKESSIRFYKADFIVDEV